MQIFNINKYNNSSIIFNGKVPVKKVATNIAILSSAVVGEISMAQNSNLYNKYADDDKKIEEYLLNAIQTQERISKRKMAKDLGIGFNTCRHKTEKGSPLYELWKQTNYAYKRKKKTDAPVIKKEAESDEINIKLLQIMTKACENKTPLTFSQIGEQIGLSRENCRSKIRRNEKLSDIWKKMEHPIPQETDNINQQIEDFLQEYIEKGKPVNRQLIVDKLGLTKEIVRWRIKTNPQLTSMMAQAGYSKSTEESQEINKKIEAFLRQSITNNVRIGLSDIAEKIGLSISGIKGRLSQNQVLADLWGKTLHFKRKSEKSQKTLIIEEKLKQLMDFHTKENIQTQLKELAEEIGISYDRCLRIVLNNPELRELWQKTPKKIVNNGAKEYVPEENKKLISIMEIFLSKGIKVNGKQISKEAGISLDIFYQRTKRFPEIGELWLKLKNLDKQASDNINKQIENVLKEALLNKSFISNRRLARLVGTAKQTCAERIYKSEHLTNLWSQVEANREQAITEKQNKIKAILERTIDNKQTIRRPEIAKKAGIGIRACSALISTTPELKALWSMIDKTSNKTDSKELSREIENILTEANSQGQKLNINQIADFLDTTEGFVKDKLTRYPKLNKLWKENKKVTNNLLKQIHSFKLNNMSNDNIQMELDLEDDVYENLMAKYSDLSKILESHQDKNISNEDYINWALLSRREYELITHKIFEKMGYKTTVTRYLSDGGVDVIAEKDGKSTIIECIQNLKAKERAKEVLALEGVRAANNINNAILITASGILMNAENCIENININNPNSFKVLNLEDMIKLAKKYNIDINSIDYNDFEENNETMLNYDAFHSWHYKKSDQITDKQREKWLKMSQERYEEKIVEHFIQKGYSVTSIVRDTGINGFYLLERDGQKIIINCGCRNKIPIIDDVRSLYGCKTAYNADMVILIGTSGISSSEKSYIDSINNQKGKEETFKTISFDKMVELLETNI